MNEFYSYQETLHIVEKFMIDSKIREYCETICKGQCCSKDCYGSSNACYKNEGRRLSCSCFICLELAHELFGDDYRTEDKITDLNVDITNVLHKTMHSNAYFNVHTLEVQRKFKIPIKSVKQLEDLNIDDVKKIMNHLIKKKIQVKD